MRQDIFNLLSFKKTQGESKYQMSLARHTVYQNENCHAMLINLLDVKCELQKNKGILKLPLALNSFF